MLERCGLKERGGAHDCAAVIRRRRELEVLPGTVCSHAAARCARQESLLIEVGLHYILERVSVFTDSGGQIVNADRPAGKFFKDSEQKAPVDEVETDRVYVKHG